jgi:hypothetical protein
MHSSSKVCSLGTSRLEKCAYRYLGGRRRALPLPSHHFHPHLSLPRSISPLLELDGHLRQGSVEQARWHGRLGFRRFSRLRRGWAWRQTSRVLPVSRSTPSSRPGPPSRSIRFLRPRTSVPFCRSETSQAPPHPKGFRDPHRASAMNQSICLSPICRAKRNFRYRSFRV